MYWYNRIRNNYAKSIVRYRRDCGGFVLLHNIFRKQFSNVLTRRKADNFNSAPNNALTFGENKNAVSGETRPD